MLCKWSRRRPGAVDQWICVSMVFCVRVFATSVCTYTASVCTFSVCVWWIYIMNWVDHGYLYMFSTIWCMTPVTMQRQQRGPANKSRILFNHEICVLWVFVECNVRSPLNIVIICNYDWYIKYCKRQRLWLILPFAHVLNKINSNECTLDDPIWILIA